MIIRQAALTIQDSGFQLIDFLNSFPAQVGQSQIQTTNPQTLQNMGHTCVTYCNNSNNIEEIIALMLAKDCVLHRKPTLKYDAMSI